MTADLHQPLRETFQLQTFRPGQQAVMESLLAGRSSLAVFPTGGGKSLCYQLPALLLEGLTLVVSPLIALMKDQVDQLNALHIPAARLDSSLDRDQLKTLYQQLDAGQIKLLYVAPERLANERFLARLQRLTVSMMAVDEAHCVSEWGHNFRPDYLKLAQLARQLNVGRVLALTATATPQVAEQIRDSFQIAPADHVQTGFYRPNLALTVTSCNGDERDERLLRRLRERPREPAIVYVTLQKTAEQVARRLADQGLNARAYHAGLPGEQRHGVQEAFMGGDTDVVVATVAFGMGIDKADIRAIYHYNLPKSLENYMQEIGRAGRDGQPSHCEMLANPADLTVLENFSHGDTPDSEALAGVVHWLLAQPPRFDLSVYRLSAECDLRPLVLNTLLTYLELDGVLASTAPFYSEYKVAFEADWPTLLKQFDAARADFLQRLFDTGKKGRIWLTLQPDDAAEQLGEPRQRIINALEYLQQQGWVRLQVAGVRQGYRLDQPVTDVQALITRLHQHFLMREQRDIQRLHQVCDWAETDTCHQQALVGYFGETLAQPCGQCSACRGEAVSLPARNHALPDPAVIQSLRQERHAALASPRQLARFLCGISSPQAGRARLARHAQFGSHRAVPFAAVLAACESQPNRRHS